MSEFFLQICLIQFYTHVFSISVYKIDHCRGILSAIQIIFFWNWSAFFISEKHKENCHLSNPFARFSTIIIISASCSLKDKIKDTNVLQSLRVSDRLCQEDPSRQFYKLVFLSAVRLLSSYYRKVFLICCQRTVTQESDIFSAHQLQNRQDGCDYVIKGGFFECVQIVNELKEQKL